MERVIRYDRDSARNLQQRGMRAGREASRNRSAEGVPYIRFEGDVSRIMDQWLRGARGRSGPDPKFGKHRAREEIYSCADERGPANDVS